MPEPRIEAAGDAALLVTLGDELDLAVNARVHRLAAALDARRASLPGFEGVVPGHASLLATFDPERCPEDRLRALVASVAGGIDARRSHGPAAVGRLHEIPVSYGGADGPDLADVAARTGLAEAEVIRLHAGVEYRVLVLGFVPGFPYLGILPAALELPRRPTPRVRVAAGSVAIAGRQSAIYPAETAGGWHLIGRTHARLWDPRRDPPALLAAGDRVRFVPA